MNVGETELVSIDLGQQTLEIEQVKGLSELAIESIRSRSDRPYWAYLWPSARALARLVGELPELEGKRVLDLGCGLGALAIAAATKGGTVVAADLRPEAIELVTRNAARHGLEIDARVMDWSEPPADLGGFDFILAADVFYEDGMLRGVLRFLRRHLQEGGLAWIADPMRVMPGGVEGACRLHGLESNTVVLNGGTTLTGGVMLYELWPRARRS